MCAHPPAAASASAWTSARCSNRSAVRSAAAMMRSADLVFRGGPVPDGGPAPPSGPVPDGGPAPAGGPVPDGGPAPASGPVPDGGPAPASGPVAAAGPAPPFRSAVMVSWVIVSVTRPAVPGPADGPSDDSNSRVAPQRARRGV